MRDDRADVSAAARRAEGVDERAAVEPAEVDEGQRAEGLDGREGDVVGPAEGGPLGGDLVPEAPAQRREGGEVDAHRERVAGLRELAARHRADGGGDGPEDGGWAARAASRLQQAMRPWRRRKARTLRARAAERTSTSNARGKSPRRP